MSRDYQGEGHLVLNSGYPDRTSETAYTLSLVFDNVSVTAEGEISVSHNSCVYSHDNAVRILESVARFVKRGEIQMRFLGTAPMEEYGLCSEFPYMRYRFEYGELICEKGRMVWERTYEELTKSRAVELFRRQWTDMQRDLGDDPSPEQRSRYKKKWIREKFPGRTVTCGCFLCEYVARRHNGECSKCPIKWPKDVDEGPRCQGYPIPETDWRFAFLSEILALPVKEE